MASRRKAGIVAAVAVLAVAVGMLPVAVQSLQFEKRCGISRKGIVKCLRLGSITVNNSCRSSSPSHFADDAKRAMATMALSTSLVMGTLLGSANVAHAAAKGDAFQVELNAPILIKRLKSPEYQRELIDALREVQDVVGPDAIKVIPPSNVGGAFRDALQGKAEVTVNGQPVDVALLESEKGEVTIRVSNPLLPKIPIISPSTRIPFLPPSGGDIDGMNLPVGQKEKPDLGTIVRAAWFIFGPSGGGDDIDLISLLARAYGWDLSTPFWEQKFWGGAIRVPVPRADDRGGAFTYVPTNKDALGSISLGLGTVYGGAYAYHAALIEQEEQVVIQKKKDAEAKKAAKAKREKKEIEKEEKEGSAGTTNNSAELVPQSQVVRTEPTEKANTKQLSNKEKQVEKLVKSTSKPKRSRLRRLLSRNR